MKSLRKVGKVKIFSAHKDSVPPGRKCIFGALRYGGKNIGDGHKRGAIMDLKTPHLGKRRRRIRDTGIGRRSIAAGEEGPFLVGFMKLSKKRDD